MDIPRNPSLTPRGAPIAVGEAAPSFTLLDQDRRPVSLADLLSRAATVVLSFYPLDFTSVCGEEMCGFSTQAPGFQDAGALVVGISCDSFAAHKAWRERDSVSIDLLSDIHREVCKGYGFYWPELNIASRGTVVVGGDGVVKWVEAREPGSAADVARVLAEAAPA